MDERFVVVSQTGSTNADMKALAQAGWPEGRWLRAERQTAGKGRLGRAWLGEPGNLFASTLVELRPADPPPTGIALLTGVAVHDALAVVVPGAGFTLKWPNDVMLGQAKLAGMLLERVDRGVVVGIGVNVAHAPSLPDRETVALSAVKGAEAVDAAALLGVLAESFAHWLGRWRAHGFSVVRDAWQSRGHGVGDALTVHLPDGEVLRGYFVSLGISGELIVGLDGGATRAIHAGDVGLLHGVRSGNAE